MPVYVGKSGFADALRCTYSHLDWLLGVRFVLDDTIPISRNKQPEIGLNEHQFNYGVGDLDYLPPSSPPPLSPTSFSRGCPQNPIKQLRLFFASHPNSMSSWKSSRALTNAPRYCLSLVSSYEPLKRKVFALVSVALSPPRPWHLSPSSLVRTSLSL